MLKIIKVFLCMLYVTLAEELYDVTTVYHVGTNYNNTPEENIVEVHLRTNARGLPIFYKGKVVADDSIIGRIFPALDTTKYNNSLWQTKDWTRTFGLLNTLMPTHLLSEQVLERKLFDTQKLPGTIKIKLNGYIRSGYFVDILILPQKSQLVRTLSGFYRIFLSNNNNENILMYCTNGKGSTMYFQDTDNVPLIASCEKIEHFQIYDWKVHVHSAVNMVVLDFSNGGLQIWSGSHQLIKVLGWQPSQDRPPINPRYLSMCYEAGTDYGLKASISTYEVSVLEANNSHPLISPWFTADMDYLCLAVVAKGFIVLNIKAENTEGSNYVLDVKGVNQYKKSLETVYLTSPLPNQLKGKNIRLILTPTTNETFTLQRISSCNGEGEGDVALLRLEEVEAINPPELREACRRKEVSFDVNFSSGYRDKRWCHKNLHQLDSNVTLTSNGGCINGSTFACPPGFVGDKCETACGRNSFGLDCGGNCSKYAEECKGIRLCTPVMGCHCAPGYYGEKCEEQCELGTYGNDCDQTCGHCAEQSNCDIYTGHCVTCEPGYFPPYCKDTFPVVKNAPTVTTPSFGKAEVTPILSDYSGRGVPTMYQIQYKESQQEINKWIVQDTFYNNLSDIVSTTIQGLSYGKLYEVRVILSNDNAGSYQGEDVPTTKFFSLCQIPDLMDYNITSTINTTSMTISWDYKNTSEYWCPVQYYQVSRKVQWMWVTENTTDTSFSLTGLLSGEIIKFRVKAFTTLGAAPYSKTVSVSTVVVSGPVQSLSFQHKGNFGLTTWDPPRKITSEKIEYRIKYQCLRRIACTLECDPSDHLEIQTSNTNVTLSSLMPFTQYLITVSAGKGPDTSLEIGTKISVPTETVKASRLSPVRTNNSVTVFWEPVEVCSGFFKGYIYQLYKADDPQIVKTGFTKENHVTIDGLSAKTDYIARIYIENIVGWNANKYLLLNISTSATVPEKVENLTVYKRGRNLLGLRWEQPKKMYGVLKSFTINYGYKKNNNTIVVSPTPCIVWPDLYCHTLDNLSPNQKYTVTVAAKNAELAEDGEPSSVIETTKEGTAGLPESVEVVNTTSTSFAMAWKYPSMAKGIIRSFLLSVEETERFESDKCCDIYPLVETIVKEELVNYSVEVAGLHPASTYTVSLSAKTVSFGPSITLTIYTRPPSMPLKYLPEIYMPNHDTWTWLPQNLLENLNNSEIYQPLIKGSILLVVLDSTNPDFNSGIENKQLLAELKKLIKTDFYFVTENKKGVQSIITEENVQSVWGTTNIPDLKEGQPYSLAVVQISEYCSVYNIDVVFSPKFTSL